MNPITRRPGSRIEHARRTQLRREGIELLVAIAGVMWVVEVINTIDSNQLDGDGIYARSVPHLWGILTAPFIHGSFQHLIDNTIPFLFMGLIIALRGAVRLALVTLIVIVLGGLGTWLIGPSHVSTIGASGVVFGFATYLFARGFFDRRALELLTGLIVGVIWGGALLASLVPHTGVSWQGHLCGALAGVIAAALLRRDRPSALPVGRPAGAPAGALSK
jgi:membrane associated rhomboid family serine protease